eukprot:GEMP01018222.1.p1 GENE.GEMP01018222.1~~GEMP01018222.1.p1  ORF type:complete len:734 (+),score=73.36 GEMP01018222.1:97-2298(+)
MSLPVSSSPITSPRGRLSSGAKYLPSSSSSRADSFDGSEHPMALPSSSPQEREVPSSPVAQLSLPAGDLPVSSSPRESDGSNASSKDDSEDTEKQDTFPVSHIAPRKSIEDMQTGSKSLGVASVSGSKSVSRIARQTRASFRARTSLEDTFSNQLGVLVMVQSALMACGLVVAAYACIRNLILCDPEVLIAAGFTDKKLHKAIPNVIWSFALDYGVVFGFVGSQCVLTLVMCFISPAIRPTMTQYWSFAIGTSIVMFGCSIAAFCVNARFRTYARGVVLISMVSCLTCVSHLNGRRYQKNHPETAERNRKLAWLVLKFGIWFFLGYYFKIEFAQTMFPFVKTRVQDLMLVNGEPCTRFHCQVIQSATELLCVSLFFSVYFPFWSRVICYIALQISDCYNDDLSTNVEVLERIQVCMNYLIDLLRFIYGRGVLFKLSHPGVFIILVLKDNAYNLWHFAFKYSPSYIVFMLKVFYPGGGRGIRGAWRYMAKIIEIFVRAMGIPKKLAVNWVDEVDFRESDPTKCTFDRLGSIVAHSEPETPVSIAIRFANVQVNINNVPVSLGKTLAGQMRESDEKHPIGLHMPSTNVIMGSLGLASTGSRDSAKSTGSVQSFKTKVRRGSIALTGLDQTAPAPERGAAAGKIATGADKQADACTDSVELHGPGDYPSFPYLPVSTDELSVLRGLCECIQFKIFQRYQTRFLTKFYTSYLFMFIPMFAQLTITEYCLEKTYGFQG